MERIAAVGYINDEKQHALISIYNPAIINAGADFVQTVLTIDGAMALQVELNEFLASHGRSQH